MLVPPYVPDDLLDERVVGVHKAEGGDVGAAVSEVLQVHQVQVLSVTSYCITNRLNSNKQNLSNVYILCKIYHNI